MIGRRQDGIPCTKSLSKDEFNHEIIHYFGFRNSVTMKIAADQKLPDKNPWERVSNSNTNPNNSNSNTDIIPIPIQTTLTPISILIQILTHPRWTAPSIYHALAYGVLFYQKYFENFIARSTQRLISFLNNI